MMKREITCCFTGHRTAKLPWGENEDAPDCRRLKAAIADVLEAVYTAGYRCFFCGMADGADMYFGEAVAALREEHPDVRLEAAVPFPGQERRLSAAGQARYIRLKQRCDAVTVIRPKYTRGCMMERNRYMVDRSALLIAVYDGRQGGTKSTIHYAAARGLEIIELPVTGLPEESAD